MPTVYNIRAIIALDELGLTSLVRSLNENIKTKIKQKQLFIIEQHY